MIEIHKEIIESIPLLHVISNGNEGKALPLIIFIHGFTSAKEHNLHYAYLLAQEGFRVILPEANLHGERSDERTVESLAVEFWNIVTQSISELEVLKRHYEQNGLIHPQQIGVVGTSMGGIITLGALTQYSWINSAVSLMGSPNYVKFAEMQVEHIAASGTKLPYTEEDLKGIYETLKKYDLSEQPEKLANRPLMFWHGMKDTVVPYEPTYLFYEKIKDQYEDKSRLKFLSDDHAGHKVTREALLQTVEWFKRHNHAF